MAFSTDEYEKQQIDAINHKLTKSASSIAFTTCATFATAVGACLTTGMPQTVLGCATFASAAVLAGLGMVRGWRQEELMDLESRFVQRQATTDEEKIKAKMLKSLDKSSQKMADYKTAIIFAGMCFGTQALSALAPNVGTIQAMSASAVVAILGASIVLSPLVKKGQKVRQERSNLINTLLIRRTKTQTNEIASVAVDTTNSFNQTLANKSSSKDIKI